MKIFSDKELFIFWKNRQNMFKCETCNDINYLNEDYKKATIIQYRCCGYLECIHCMVNKYFKTLKVNCNHCNNEFSLKKFKSQVQDNLNFLIQDLLNKNESDFCDSRNEYTRST